MFKKGILEEQVFQLGDCFRELERMFEGSITTPLFYQMPTFSRNYYLEAARTLGVKDEEKLIADLKDFEKEKTDHSFGRTFLRGYIKNGAEISDLELTRYNLEYSTRPQINENYVNKTRASKVYADANFVFLLKYNKDSIAILSFDPDKAKIRIKQIQGVGGREYRLKPIKWERALVNYAVQWARENGISEVVVNSSKNNTWAEIKGTEHGKILYDVTARRCGFNQDQEGNYSKIVAL